MPSKRKIKSYEDRIRYSITTLEHLLSPSGTPGRGSVLADLFYRSEEPSGIDGYPKGMSGEATSGGGTSDPTGGTVMARGSDICTECGGTGNLPDDAIGVRTCHICRGSGRRWADPVVEAVKELLSNLVVMDKAARIVDSRRDLVMNTAQRERGRKSTLAECDCCDKTVTGVGSDRLKRGWCNACYLAWGTWRLVHPDSDRTSFVIQRRAYLAEREGDEMAEIDRLQDAKVLPMRSSA